MQIYFDNYQRMPQFIKIAGCTKPSSETIGSGRFEDDLTPIDEDRMQCLDLGTYQRIDATSTDTGWTTPCHPRIGALIRSYVPREVYLKGDEDTGVWTNRTKFCKFQRHETEDVIYLSFRDLLDYLELKDEVSDELPMFFRSMDIAESSSAGTTIQPILYQLTKARF